MEVPETYPLKVYPNPASLQLMLRPAQTQVFSGDEVSRRKGDGIEFADVRPFMPGDRVRRINWRMSSRLGQLHVNELHPERNSDVVIFLDAFAELKSEHRSTLDPAIRAAVAIAHRYLRRRDRVGLVRFGGTLSWLSPATGSVQLYQILEALLETHIYFSYVWRGIDVIPVRTLPPDALVIAISPLLDMRSLGALLDLRARGFDLVVIEISPEDYVRPLERDEVKDLAFRLWKLRRELVRDRFHRLGVPVSSWPADQELESVMEELRRYRRAARLVRV
jgi:uncharacterized protein (DUF58 family)